MPGIKLRSQLGMTPAQVEARAIDAAKAKALEPMSGRSSMVTGIAAAVVVGVTAVFAWPHLAPLFAARPAAVVAAVPATPQGLDAQEALAGPTGAPLLWKVQKNKATVYLFGSVHVLNAGLKWADPRLYAAFDNAAEAWFEIVDLDQETAIDKGADHTLFTRAKLMNKRINGLESFAAHAGYLRPTAADAPPDAGEDDPNILAEQWRSGDQKAMTAAVLSEKVHTPRDYDRLLVRRNGLWLPQIEKMLNGDRTVFVTVGTAHMFGPDGLIAQLRAKGYEVTRVER